MASREFMAIASLSLPLQVLLLLLKWIESDWGADDFEKDEAARCMAMEMMMIKGNDAANSISAQIAQIAPAILQVFMHTHSHAHAHAYIFIVSVWCMAAPVSSHLLPPNPTLQKLKKVASCSGGIGSLRKRSCSSLNVEDVKNSVKPKRNSVGGAKPRKAASREKDPNLLSSKFKFRLFGLTF